MTEYRSNDEEFDVHPDELDPEPAVDDGPGEYDAPGAAERLEAPDESGGLNWRFVVGLLVAVAGIGSLVLDGMGSQTYFFTVDEAVAKAKSVVGERIRVKGTVVEGSIEGKKGSIGRNFTISAKGETIRIRYDQAMPDTFKPEAQVVATGTLEEPGALKAEKVLVKCPSRYEGKPPTAHKKAKGNSNYQ